MIPHDQPARKQMIARMLDPSNYYEEARTALTKWENDFIDSITEQFNNRGDLSNRQCEILERIYDKL